MSGSFSKMLDRIAGYIGQQIETRKMAIGAVIYPAIIGGLAVGVTVFLLSFGAAALRVWCLKARKMSCRGQRRS